MLPGLLAPQRKTEISLSRTHSTSPPNFHCSSLSSNYWPLLDGYYIKLLMYVAPTYDDYILKMRDHVWYFISPALYHNSCHVGVGGMDEWCFPYSHSTYNLWLFEKENQYSCNILVPRSSLCPCWNNFLWWLVHYLIMQMTALWYFYLIHSFDFI